MIATLLADRVAEGVKMLDALQPGWYKEIDLEILDLEGTDTCVLGQLYGGWVEGTEYLGIDGDRYLQSHYGFELTEEEYSGPRWLFEALTDEWRKVIADKLYMSM